MDTPKPIPWVVGKILKSVIKRPKEEGIMSRFTKYNYILILFISLLRNE
jgi:hypothetical protein